MSPMTHLRANSLCEAPDSDDHVQLGHTWALGRVLEGLLSGLCVGVSAGLSLAGLGASGSEFGDLGVGSFCTKGSAGASCSTLDYDESPGVFLMNIGLPGHIIISAMHHNVLLLPIIGPCVIPETPQVMQTEHRVQERPQRNEGPLQHGNKFEPRKYNVLHSYLVWTTLRRSLSRLSLQPFNNSHNGTDLFACFG